MANVLEPSRRTKSLSAPDQTPEVTTEWSTDYSDETHDDFVITEFLQAKAALATMKKKTDELQRRAAAVIERMLPESDGHQYVRLAESAYGYAGVQRQRRVSRSVDLDTALTILGEAGLNECIRVVPAIDDDAVYGALLEGKLTDEQVDAMYPEKVTYAIVPIKE